MAFGVNWGACLLGVCFDDDTRTFNVYFGPFVITFGGDDDLPPVRHA